MIVATGGAHKAPKLDRTKKILVLGPRFGTPNGLAGFRILGDLLLRLFFFPRSTLCPVLFGGQE